MKADSVICGRGSVWKLNLINSFAESVVLFSRKKSVVSTELKGRVRAVNPT